MLCAILESGQNLSREQYYPICIHATCNIKKLYLLMSHTYALMASVITREKSYNIINNKNYTYKTSCTKHKEKKIICSCLPDSCGPTHLKDGSISRN